MASRDALLLRPARTFLDTRTSDERQEIIRIIEDICADPLPDAVLRFALDEPPDFPVVYRDDKYYVLYNSENPWTLAIWDIGYASDHIRLINKPDE